MIGFHTVSAYSISVTQIPYHPDMDRKSSTITWIRDPKIVNEKLTALDKKYGDIQGTTVGYAEWKSGKCKIWALEPINEYDREAMDTLGHEMLHCFRGDFHDE